MKTDGQAVYTVPSSPRPAYMVPTPEPTFGGFLTRIANDAGMPAVPVVGSWGSDTRHAYSKQQPWSSDNSLLLIQNRSPGSPPQLFLNGSTYVPLFGPCAGANLYDYRWHPSKAHPHELINVDASGTQLSWYDVTTCTRTRVWTLPLTANYGIGSGEGNASFDGRYVLVANNTDMAIVDMDPKPPFAPYPSKRIGPVYHIPPESVTVASPGTWSIDNVSISPSGRYVDLKFSGPSDTTEDMHRIFEVDSMTLTLTPHRMDTSALRCGSFAARPNGWIFPLKHSDMTLDPSDHNEDVIIGGRSCPGSGIGKVVKVRLRDGMVTALSDPANEASVVHVSAQNYDRPGWVYVSYYKQAGKRFSDEIVAVKLDGSKQVERLAHAHTEFSSCYRCEAHPAPSRDGTRVLFASNWMQDCSVCGTPTAIKDYVISQAPNVAVTPPPPPPIGTPAQPDVEASLGLQNVWPTPSNRLPHIAYSLRLPSAARLELVDVAGRVVLHRDLGAPGAGRHELDLSGETAPAPGMYWLRLRQEGAAEASHPIVITR